MAQLKSASTIPAQQGTPSTIATTRQNGALDRRTPKPILVKKAFPMAMGQIVITVPLGGRRADIRPVQPAGSPTTTDWRRWCDLAKSAAAQSVQAWIDNAIVIGNDASPDGAWVKANRATIPRGAFSSYSWDFDPMRISLQNAGVPLGMAYSISSQTAAAWTAWMNGFSVEASLFPQFAAWPMGPDDHIGTPVPPTPNLPYFGLDHSKGESNLAGLANSICAFAALRGANFSTRDRVSVEDYTNWFYRKCTAWSRRIHLKVFGQGSIYETDTVAGGILGSLAYPLSPFAIPGAVIGAVIGSHLGKVRGSVTGTEVLQGPAF